MKDSTKHVAGLRFDKVATRLTDRLKAACQTTIPDGTIVMLAITAPIRLASKTAASIEDTIATLARRRSAGRDVNAIINGNRVRIRLVKHKSERAPKFVAFVHNPDVDPVVLFKMTRERLDEK
jgi:hypothetical protein